ncbi:hypothetical protein HYN56_21135 [Flavobacterium crocinum]|uniref:Uncharacterized protein n=1 Tax=Flavobacterium crocinum TaxID=2183896 RepID=A0A2S1YR77_9FLAO|nr:hypothetical protein [Flavobacterium crocinum]AWK06597.1 hypothetical protein HYN56_21135 [Flavobacterium crocinum]
MKQKADHQKAEDISETELLHHVRLSINPKFQDWVLFKNGTYIIFEQVNEISSLESEALKLIHEFGPVCKGERSEDFDVTDLKNTEGWIVSGYGYGIYTYVSPQEIKSKKTNTTIGLFGRGKRDLDSKNPVIIHINRKLKS